MSVVMAQEADVRDRKIALVVGVARNRVIGLDGKMPWHVSSDLKLFRRITMGRPVIMGRKTFQSIGKPLDGRTNIVVTRDPEFVAEGAQVAGSLSQALDMARRAPSTDNCIMVIGGGEIYRRALEFADTIYMTEIEAEPEGDTWFPELDPSIWLEIDRQEIAPSPRDTHGAALVTYQRKDA